MRANILKIIAERSDVTNAIVLTHNIDFVFLQTVVLNRLRKAGNPSLTIFADAHQAMHSYLHQAPVLDTIGSRYRVVPVPSKPGFCFHPKAIVLSSPDRATLLVGSGNLTFGGWSGNAECWVRFDTEVDGTERFSSILGYLNSVLTLLPMPEAVGFEVAEAFDPASKTWATDMGEPTGLIGRIGTGPPLINGIGEAIGGDPVDRLTICSPYFDSQGQAMLDLSRAVSATSTRLLIQPRRSGLRRGAAEATADVVELQPHDFLRIEGEKNHSAFMHAKLLAFERANTVELFIGSANCSRAALTIPGSGNSELMAHVTLEADRFQADALGELVPVDNCDLGLDEHPIYEDELDIGGPTLQLLGASFDHGKLTVAYSSSPGVVVTKCLIDGEDCHFETKGPDRIEVTITQPPRTVSLEGMLGKEIFRACRLWIDHEAVLRSTAGQRNLERAFREGVRPGVWSLEAWSEIAEIFGKHLKYMPTRVPRSHGPGGPGGAGGNKIPIEFTAEDVFTATYTLDRQIHHHQLLNEATKLTDLQGLLLRWFGLETEKHDDEIDIVDDGNEDDQETHPDGEEGVDKPENPLKSPRTPKEPTEKSVSDRDRRKALRILKALATSLSAPDFLRHRPPTLLGGDLKIASAILRSALREGWIDEAEFCNHSIRIWKALFFTSEENLLSGWIEFRNSSAENPAMFREMLADSELAAALIGWYLAIPEETTSIEGAEFQLAAALAFGRLPWLWAGDSIEISTELANLLLLTSTKEQLQDSVWSDFERRWQQLVKDGHAFYAVGELLSEATIPEIRELIEQASVHRGELLWQGRLGFCVALNDVPRTDRHKVSVKYLQARGKKPSIMASFAVPVRALLTERVVRSSDDFDSDLVARLDSFVERLAKGFSVDR